MSVQKPRHDHGQRGAVQHLHGMAKPGPGHPEHSHGREARGEGQLNGAYAPQPGTYLGAACSQLAPGRMLSADPGTCSSHLRETPLSTRLPQIGPVTAQATPARARPGVHGAQPWHSAIMASLGKHRARKLGSKLAGREVQVLGRFETLLVSGRGAFSMARKEAGSICTS